MFTKSDKHNPNYLASIVKITEFRPHPNANKLKMVSLFGNNVITGINASPGLYCYFPLECSISPEFITFTNSFRLPEMNADKRSKAFFEAHCRVKALSLRSAKSEGYIVPVSELERFSKEILGKDLIITDKHVGTDFDLLFDHVFCKKYIPKGTYQGDAAGKKTHGNVKRYASKLVEKQFAFHSDTKHLKREVGCISPDDYISVVNKIHGCNFIVSNVLIRRQLSIRDKIAKFFGATVVDTEYGMLYSSRSVIKNENLLDS